MEIEIGSDFSGVGAFEFALSRVSKTNGFTIKNVFACDMDKFARQSYLANHKEPGYYPENVYNREIPEESLDIYMTSPPCQSFSLAGKRKGKDSKNGILFFNSHEFIQKNKPRFFVFENVKGLLSDDKGKTFSEWVNMLGGKSINGLPVIFPYENSAPYHIYHKVLNSKKHGVPQNRERVFIVGIRDDKDNQFTWPKEEHLKTKLKDVLEENVDQKYFLSKKMLKGLIKEKSNFEGRFKPLTGNEHNANCITTAAGSRVTDNFIIDGYINQKTQASRVFSDKGVGPTLAAGSHGCANGYININSDTKKGTENIELGSQQAVYLTINQTVKVRKYKVDEKALSKLLKEKKGKITIDFISKQINEPKSKVAHWFRSDKSFSIPIADKWDKLKEILSIEDNSFDKSIKTFEEKKSNFDQNNRVYDSNFIAPTITASTDGEKIIIDKENDKSILVGTWRTHKDDKGFRQTADNNCPTIPARAREDGSGQPVICIPVLTPDRLNKRQNGRRFKNDGDSSFTLTTQDKHGIYDGVNIRRLTPRECFRLQAFPDSFKFVVSDTQLYKQAGNSITVDVLEKIIRGLKKLTSK